MSHNQQPSLYLTDGGLETVLVFEKGIDLPCFAACDLLRSPQGVETLKDYYRAYLDLAMSKNASSQLGFVLESPTWRCNPNWIAELQWPPEDVEKINAQGIELMKELRDEYRDKLDSIIINGCLGPATDGYVAGTQMTIEAASDYHAYQIRAFANAGADHVSAMTITYINEAIGIVMASKKAGLPVSISFTIETDSKLPTGDSVKDAIRQVDEATDRYASFFLLNCMHPTHLDMEGLPPATRNRIGGFRFNASKCSHAELDQATELDAGDPIELGKEYTELLKSFPNCKVVGGCCGTNHVHVAQLRDACLEHLTYCQEVAAD